MPELKLRCNGLGKKNKIGLISTIMFPATCTAFTTPISGLSKPNVIILKPGEISTAPTGKNGACKLTPKFKFIFVNFAESDNEEYLIAG